MPWPQSQPDKRPEQHENELEDEAHTPMLCSQCWEYVDNHAPDCPYYEGEDDA